jgi:hypothetical protein
MAPRVSLRNADLLCRIVRSLNIESSYWGGYKTSQSWRHLKQTMESTVEVVELRQAEFAALRQEWLEL